LTSCQPNLTVSSIATGLEEETIPVPTAAVEWQPCSTVLHLAMCAGNLAIAKPSYGTNDKCPLGSNPCSREIASWLRKSAV